MLSARESGEDPGEIEVLELLEADLRLLTDVQETATIPPHVRLHWMKNQGRWSKQWVLKLMAQPHCPQGVGADLSSLRRPEILDSLAKSETPEQQWEFVQRLKKMRLV